MFFAHIHCTVNITFLLNIRYFQLISYAMSDFGNAMMSLFGGERSMISGLLGVLQEVSEKRYPVS